MSELPESEKREIFKDTLQRVMAIDFPNPNDDPQRIYILFHDEELLKRAVYFLQDNQGLGFSLIIEKVDSDRINLKIYEPDTDDFHVCNGVVVGTNIFEKYQKTYHPNTLLSVGLLEIVDSQPKFRHVTFLNIPVRSIDQLHFKKRKINGSFSQAFLYIMY